MSASDQSITRVNYFNGQRLDADDFRAEQDYQIAVRRELYSALYPAGGVVAGLEVTPHPTDQHKVVVAPGVALDFLGREIILLSSTDVIAAGTPSTNPAAIFGNYLVISYTEQRTLALSDGCVLGNGACGGNLTWGAATRIVAQPKLQFTDTFPAPSSGQIVLAQIALGSGCQVGQIVTGVRQYAVPAKPPVTRAISLEGEKDIDSNNPKILYFHIDGSIPSTATLYLRAAQFSTLYYTELGAHTHANSVTFNNMATLANHTHPLTSLTTDKQLGGNTVQATVNTTSGAVGDYAVRLWQPATENTNLTTSQAQFKLQGIEHAHTIAAGGETSASTDIGSTTPSGTLSNASAGQVSLTGQGARNGAGKWLGYVNALTVSFDGTDITDAIRTQLAGNDPGHWPTGTTLGDGTGTNPLVIQGDGTGGTGAIALDKLGLNFSPGQHSLKFAVATGGGQIQYNLYVG